MVSIGVVDDHEIVREGFKRLIELEQGLTVSDEYSCYDDAVEGLRKQCVDLLIVDVSLQGKSGIELMGYVNSEYPQIRIIALSMYDNEPYVSQAINNGALAYLSKRIAPVELVDAIKFVLKGETYLSQDVAANVKSSHIEQSNNNINRLTDREFEIFKLLAKGFFVKEIATKLDVQPKTVHTHKANLFKKLEVKNRFELLRLALANNVLGYDELTEQ